MWHLALRQTIQILYKDQDFYLYSIILSLLFNTLYSEYQYTRTNQLDMV